MIPFSRRTTTAVTVFANISAARDAWKLTSDASQISSLHQIHAALFRLYRQVCHQDVENQAAVLDALIPQVQTQLQALDAVVQAITPTPQNEPMLEDIQTVVSNSIVQMNWVEIAGNQ